MGNNVNGEIENRPAEEWELGRVLAAEGEVGTEGRWVEAICEAERADRPFVCFGCMDGPCGPECLK